ncbi:hypothetical protein [Marinobacter sp.]|uniref:hypothetical protein n=1 Tax=Marinobacter sp. TaxID=50741 RepID=UPI000C952B4F|nr:hypothetical protein [Marinobacter sp.]MAB51177.1 hypothetical protein [Marinobacter sp.]|tara:strand:- start:1089 stop:2261 length:1173 start_codon:yes stop_codon:yes gene_type:complete
MSFNRLKDLRGRFEQQWINGGFIFGYENEINEKHNNDYPLLLVLPPTSELPSTEGDSREEYTFECLVVKPYYQNQSGSLDVVLSLLEQEGLTWIQRVLDSYGNKEVILSPDSISVEREKELYNDKLIQVRLTFTLDCFSHNFSFMDELFISNLSPRVWLRSDLGVKTTYSGGNEVVSKWIDQSGNGNDFEQTTATKMPSYEYELSDNGKPFLSFDGTDDFMTCVNEGISSGGNGIAHDHTIFFVAKVEDSASTGYILAKNTEESNSTKILIEARKTPEGSVLNIAYIDSLNQAAFAAGSNILSNVAVFAIKFHNKSFHVFRNGTQTFNDTEPFYDTFDFYEGKPLVIAADSIGDSRFLEMKMQEMIIFNDDFSEEQISKVTTYLQHKYNI